MDTQTNVIRGTERQTDRQKGRRATDRRMPDGFCSSSDGLIVSYLRCLELAGQDCLLVKSHFLSTCLLTILY